MQNAIEKFEEAKKNYWSDLDKALSHIVIDAIRFFRYPEDNKVIEDGLLKYIEIGVIKDEGFRTTLPTLLPTKDLKIQFVLKILLGTSTETAKYMQLYRLNFYRKKSVYYIESQDSPFGTIVLGTGKPESIDFRSFFTALGKNLENMYSVENFN